MADLTGLLNRCSTDPAARDEFFRLVYDHLRRIAAARVSEWPDAPLQPTELVNEAYIKVFKGDALSWKGRGQFFAFVSKVMANFLKDQWRHRTAGKRGGGRADQPLIEADGAHPGVTDETIRLIDLLDELARDHPLTARIAELHFCAGRSFEEIAEILRSLEPPAELVVAEVAKHWAFTRAWMRDRLTRGDA
jgi:RNA polymerase sigma factor (TIGR02999 family)